MLHQPRPARAGQGQGGPVELLAQLLGVAELARDAVGQRAVRLATGPWVQALPVESVVPGLRGGFEQAALAGTDDLLQRQVLQFGAGNAGVERIDIGTLVVAVVQVQCRRREMRLQGVAGIGQVGQFDGHGPFLFGLGRREPAGSAYNRQPRRKSLSDRTDRSFAAAGRLQWR